MARQKYDPNTLQAKEKIVEVFWELLENYSLNSLTVSQIASQAQCTRGTFYYHYPDMETLIRSAIESEALGHDGVPDRIFSTMASIDSPRATNQFSNLPMYRISLVMRRGGREIAEDVITQAIIGMWKAVLCPNGEKLSAGAQIVIRYSIYGILGLVRLQGEKSDNPTTMEDIKQYLNIIVPVQLGALCKAQKISEDELKLRLSIACKFITHGTR